MKPKSNLGRLIVAVVSLSVLASFAHAGPGPQYWTALRHDSQFKDLKAGDKVDFICDGCKTISEITIKSPEHAAELCKEGAIVVCPTCKMITRVILKRQRNDPPSRTEVVYVNDKGEECAFLATRADHHEN